MYKYTKVFLISQILLYAILNEFLFFLGIKIRYLIKIVSKFPVISFNIKDEYVVSWVNRILYNGVLGLKIFPGNCQRYVLLLIIFFHNKYKHLRGVLGISKKNGKIEGHIWLENCNKVFYEPMETLERYKRIVEFKI